MANRTTRTQKKDEKFFGELAQGASVTKAAKLVGYGRSSVYEWRSTDAEFLKQMDEAVESGTDVLEDEVFRRAFEGVQKPAGWYQGEAGGHVQEYSDTLAIFLLKGRRPEKYADRAKVEHSGEVSAPVDLTKLDDEQLSTLAGILRAAEPESDQERAGAEAPRQVH